MITGSEAAELCAMAGLPSDAWQQSVLDRVFAPGSNGKAAESRIGIFAPDQSAAVRTGLQCALAWLFLGDERVFWSARESPDVTQALTALESMIISSDILRSRVARVSHLNGDEHISLHSGARITFTSRLRGAGHGFSAGKLIIDESAARPS